MQTLSWKQFYRNYLELSNKVPSYRLGQHFIIMFIKDENADEELSGLWNQTNQVLAINQCLKVIDKYQWDMDKLPIIDKGE